MPRIASDDHDGEMNKVEKLVKPVFYRTGVSSGPTRADLLPLCHNLLIGNSSLKFRVTGLKFSAGHAKNNSLKLIKINIKKGHARGHIQ